MTEDQIEGPPLIRPGVFRVDAACPRCGVIEEILVRATENVPTNELPQYLTIHQAAERLNVSWMTIRRWIDAGALPATRFGKRALRIKTATLDKFAAQFEDTPEEASND